MIAEVRVEKINIRGLTFDNVTRKEAAELAQNLMDSPGASTVFTPNAEIAYNASRDDEFMKVLCLADILLPDGAGIIKASRILGTPLKEKVAGIDFGLDVVKMCAERGFSLFLLGGKPGVADAAAKKLCEIYPDLKIAGSRDGYFEKKGEESDRIVEMINSSSTDVLFVCLGSPSQEKWAAENKDKLNTVRLLCCLGGSIDVYAGNAKRAPKVFIKTSTEWLYRLIKDPRRLGRMMALPKYIRDTKKYKKSMGK